MSSGTKRNRRLLRLLLPRRSVGGSGSRAPWSERETSGPCASADASGAAAPSELSPPFGNSFPRGPPSCPMTHTLVGPLPHSTRGDTAGTSLRLRTRATLLQAVRSQLGWSAAALGRGGSGGNLRRSGMAAFGVAEVGISTSSRCAGPCRSPGSDGSSGRRPLCGLPCRACARSTVSAD